MVMRQRQIVYGSFISLWLRYDYTGQLADYLLYINYGENGQA
jgi:hypothetical protein